MTNHSSFILAALLCASNAHAAASAGDLLRKPAPIENRSIGPTNRPVEIAPVKPKAPRLSMTEIVSGLLPPPAGTPPASNSITLSWDASPSVGVVGYNIHGGTASGIYTRVWSVGNVLTATITNLVSTNYFTASAVDATGLQSDLSNEAIGVAASAPTATNFSLYIDATTGVVVAPMLVGTNAGRTCVYSPTDETGSDTFVFNWPSDGTATVWGLAYATNSANDSFYVSYAGTPSAWFVSTNYGSWQWSRATNLTLTAGTTVVSFAGREAFTFLSQIFISNRTNPPVVATPTNYTYGFWIQTQDFGQTNWVDRWYAGATNFTPGFIRVRASTSPVTQ